MEHVAASADLSQVHASSGSYGHRFGTWIDRLIAKEMKSWGKTFAENFNLMMGDSFVVKVTMKKMTSGKEFRQ